MKMVADGTAAGANLERLASQIKEVHGKIVQSFQRTKTRACRVGRLLLEAKGACAPDKWTEWLENEFEFSVQTAYDYMRIAENWEVVKHQPSLAAMLRAMKEKKPKSAQEAFTEKTLTVALTKIVTTLGRKMKKAEVGITDVNLAKSLGTWLSAAFQTEDAWNAFVRSFQGK